jgi:very-short-patch-repair endonuclease
LNTRRIGNSRIRRVLALRPSGALPTGSILETLMVQLIRRESSLPAPKRQVEVRTEFDTFVAYVDLAWPECGLFLELDGQQHKGQPVYDARRETAVVATRGWLPGRFTWDEVHNIPKPTLGRVVELFNQATLRSNRSWVAKVS